MNRLALDPTNGVFLFCVSALLYVLFPVLLVERMVLDADALTTKIFPAYRFLSLMACSVCLFAIFYVNKLRLNLFSLLMAAFLALALAKGLFPISNDGYFFTHVSAGLSMLTFYLAGTRCFLTPEKTVSLVKGISYLFLVEYAVLTLVAYVAYQYSGLLVLENFHLSLNIAPVLVSFVYFLVEGNLTLNIFVLFLLFLSGKRSLLITAVVMYLLYFCIIDGKKRRAFVSQLKPVVVLSAAVSAIGLVYSDNLSFMGLATKRLTSLNLFDGGGVDIDNISSGRWNEFMVVYDSVTSSISDFLYGTGFGNFIQIVYDSTFDHQTYYLEKIGFDVLPVHFMYHFGLPAAILLLGCMGAILFKQYFYVRREYRTERTSFTRARLVLFLSVVSIVINSFFTYINPDPFLWFCLGLMCSEEMEARRLERQENAEVQQAIPA